MGEDELYDLLMRDLPFSRRSGGGVTLSGGEPALHPRFAGALAARLRDAGVQVLLETAGCFGWKAFSEQLLPNLDAVYFDVKLLDPGRHKAAIGVGNRRILENLERLSAAARAGAPSLLVRVPLAPGITDDPDNLAAIARHVRGLGLGSLALLPYNPLWLPKRRGLAKGEAGLAFKEERFMSESEVEACREVVRREGVSVT
jgi:pyruvate formate lyase activating enzyme